MEFSFSQANIRLRPFEPEDTPALQLVLNHPGLVGRRYIPWEFPHLAPLSRQQVESVLKKWGERENGMRLAVILMPGQRQQPEDRLVGHMALDWGWDPHNPSLALAIAPEYQRQGIGSTTLEIGLRFLFGYTPAHNVSADWVADWNTPARSFLMKHGFVKSGEPRWVGMRAGHPFNMIAMDLLKHEWQGRQNSRHEARHAD